MSCEDIPSLLGLQKVKKHADDFGRLMGTGTGTSTNGVTGQVRPTYNKVIEDLGFKPGSGDFVTGFTVMPGMRNISWKNPSPPGDNNFYSWDGPIPPTGKFVPAGSTPETTGGIGSGAWVDRSDVTLRGDLAAPGGSQLVGFQQSGAGSTPRTSQEKMREVVSVADFGASPSATSAENIAAFNKARDKVGPGGMAYVPPGSWRLTTPFDLGESFYLYGPGATLIFDKAEWRRRGASTGSVRTAEQYTLYYTPTGNDADIHVFVNATEVSWTWFSHNVIEVPAAASSVITDVISYYIVNGMHRLSNVPEDVNGYCSDLSGGLAMQTDYVTYAGNGGTGYNNVRVGSRAGYCLTTGGNNTYLGPRAGASNTDKGNNCAMGYQAMYRNNGDNNVILGSIAGEWATHINNTTAVGAAAMSSILTGDNNTAVGESCLQIQTGNNNAAVGFESHTGLGYGRSMTATTSMGTYTGRLHWGSNNANFGYSAGRGELDGATGTDTNNGSNNAFVGFFAGAKVSSGSYNVAVGGGAGSAIKAGSYTAAVGFEAGASLTKFGQCAFLGYHAGWKNTSGDITAVGYNALAENVIGIRLTAVGSAALALSNGNDNTAVGFNALSVNTTGFDNVSVGTLSGQQNTTGASNTDVGSRAGAARTTANFTTNIGRQAGVFLVTGDSNTNIGASAGRLSQDGSNATAWAGTTCIGASSAVSGNNQNQIGNSTTTTYVYGTVQNRSDERDKTDIRDTELGIEFIMGLRPVDGRWDMRDDYFEEYQVQVGIDPETAEPLFETRLRKLPKDGSKARTRKHHWFIAQEVKELCDKLGVDFGGYQDHSINSGCDVLSLGYDEFIPPTVKAVQQCWNRLDELEKRIAALE